MRAKSSRGNFHKGVKTTFGWQTMLVDVDSEIDKTRGRLRDLEQSSRIIREKIATGEPFPELHSQTG